MYAIDPGFIELHRVITHIDYTRTILRADQNSLRANWKGEGSFESRMWTESHEATFYLTNKTTFSGGSRSDVVKGRKIHITYHFEGDRAIADTITFV